MPDQSRRGLTPDHEHDWRVNPFVVYPSMPPQEEVVCVVVGCDGRYLRAIGQGGVSMHNPQTWPKAET